MLPPKPVWFVVHQSRRGRHRFVLFARGASEVACHLILLGEACALPGRYLGHSVFVLPAAAA